MSQAKYLVEFGDDESKIIDEGDIISRWDPSKLSEDQQIHFWLSRDGEKDSAVQKGVIVAISCDEKMLKRLMKERKRHQMGKSLAKSATIVKPPFERPQKESGGSQPIETSGSSTSAKIVHENRVKKILSVEKLRKESPFKAGTSRKNQKNDSWIADQLDDLVKDIDQAIALEDAGKELLSSAKQKLSFMSDAIYEPPKNTGEDTDDDAASQKSRSLSPENVPDVQPSSRRVSYKIDDSSDEDAMSKKRWSKKPKLIDYGSSSE